MTVPEDKELPRPLYQEVVTEQESIPLPDGVLLDAKLWCPDPQTAWPVVVIRNPYVSIGAMYEEKYGPILAGQGYAVLLVSVRGSLSSEGEWYPFLNEGKDGRDVLNWVGEQHWCDGNIGTMGGSYLGHTQLCMAGNLHPMLKTMFVGVSGSRSYESFYHRGMFREDIFTGWAAQMMGENRFQNRTAQEEFDLRANALATYPKRDLGRKTGGETYPWYEGWVDNPEYASSYWQSGLWKEMDEAIESIEIPIFLCGGWFDIALRAQISTFKRLPEKTRKKSLFLIGPWHHGCAPGGELTYPGENIAGDGQLAAALPWFDHYLKGKPYPYETGVIFAYSIGEDIWRTWDVDFLQDSKERKKETKKLFLAKDENKTNAKTKVLLEKAKKEEEVCSFVYDPKHPVLSRGGNLLGNYRDPYGAPECSTRQEDAGARDDVVSFLSGELMEDVFIAGSMKAVLYVSSSALATAFTVKVCEVLKDGRSFNIRDDITDIRWSEEGTFKDYEPGSIAALELDMAHITWTLKKGSRIRLDVSSSNFPAYHVHPNEAGAWARIIPQKTAEQTIYLGGKRASYLEIPVGDAKTDQR